MAALLVDTDEPYKIVVQGEGVNPHFAKRLKKALGIRRPREERLEDALNIVRAGESAQRAAKAASVSRAMIARRVRRGEVRSFHARPALLPANTRATIDGMLAERKLRLSEIARLAGASTEGVKYRRDALVRKGLAKGHIEFAVRLQWHTDKPPRALFRSETDYRDWLKLPTVGKARFREVVILGAVLSHANLPSAARMDVAARLIRAREAYHQYLKRARLPGYA